MEEEEENLEIEIRDTGGESSGDGVEIEGWDWFREVPADLHRPTLHSLIPLCLGFDLGRRTGLGKFFFFFFFFF